MKKPNFFFLLLTVGFLFNFMVMPNDDCCEVSKMLASRKESPDLKPFLIYDNGIIEDLSMDVEYCNNLVELFVMSIDRRSKNEKTPLIVAIEENKIEIVKCLVHLGVSMQETFNPSSSKFYFSPLTYAAASGNIEAFDILMTNEDNENLNADVAELNGLGNLLHISIYFGQQEMLEHLFEKYNDKVKNLVEDEKVGKTPLMLAAKLGNLGAIASLKKQGADVNRGNKYSGRTAVHFAAEARKRSSILLLHCFGADLAMPDHDLTLPYDIVELGKDFKTITTYLTLIALIKLGNSTFKKPPKFFYNSPINLVFSGGSVHALSFVEAFKSLQMSNQTKEMTRLAGISTGSIIATLLAVGYTPDEIEKIMSTDQFYYLLGVFSDCENHFDNINDLQDVFMTYKAFVKDCVYAKDTVRPYLDWLFKNDLGCNLERLRLWIENLIREKTGKEYCTFGELQELAANDKRKLFKNLHIFAAKINESLPEVYRFSSEDPQYKDLIISDALTAAISIPVIFKPQLLFYKDENNVRYSKNEDLFIDGGLFYKFLITTFDERQYTDHRSFEEWEKENPIFNVRTLGFGSYGREVNFDEEEEVTTIYELLKSVRDIWWRSMQSLMQEKEQGTTPRTIYINLEDIEEMEFSNFALDSDTKKELINLGDRAVRKFFDDEEKYFRSLFVCD